MTCRTCRHLDVPLNKDGKRRPFSEYSYRCDAPLEKKPVCIDWGRRLVMRTDDGAGCPAHQERFSKPFWPVQLMPK